MKEAFLQYEKKIGGKRQYQYRGTQREGGVSGLQKGISEEPEASVYTVIRI